MNTLNSEAPATSAANPSGRVKILLCRETRANGGWMIWEINGGNRTLLEKGYRLRQIWPNARSRAFKPGAKFDLIETNRPHEEAFALNWMPAYLGCPAGTQDPDMWCLLDLGNHASLVRWEPLKDRGDLRQELRHLDENGNFGEESRVIPELQYTWDAIGTSISEKLRGLIEEKAEKDRKLLTFQEEQRRRKEENADTWYEWRAAYRK